MALRRERRMSGHCSHMEATHDSTQSKQFARWWINLNLFLALCSPRARGEGAQRPRPHSALWSGFGLGSPGEKRAPLTSRNAFYLQERRKRQSIRSGRHSVTRRVAIACQVYCKCRKNVFQLFYYRYRPQLIRVRRIKVNQSKGMPIGSERRLCAGSASGERRSR